MAGWRRTNSAPRAKMTRIKAPQLGGAPTGCAAVFVVVSLPALPLGGEAPTAISVLSVRDPPGEAG